MRHTVSLLLAIVLTPLIYILAGWSAANFLDAGGLDPAGIQGIVAGGVAGLLFAVLTTRRLSPVGPLAGGLGFAGMTLWYLLANQSFLATFPDDLGGLLGVFTTPVPFGTTLLAVPLLAAGLSPRRWRPEPAETTPTPAPSPVPEAAPPVPAAQD